MIGRDPDVGRTALDHRQNRSEHAAHGADVLAVPIHCGRHREEMAEQLVGAVDQVDLHRSERYHFAALVFSAEQELAASRGREDWARALRTGKV